MFRIKTICPKTMRIDWSLNHSFRFNGTISAVSAKITELKQKAADKDHEFAQVKDSYLRALAEIENIRTHSSKEIKENEHRAILGFAKEVAVVAEILEKALNAVPEDQRDDKASDPDFKNLYIGVKMTQKNLLKAIETFKN
jgi:molecular chaperone GrpE